MLLTGKQPAEQVFVEIDQRVKAASSVPGLFALYDPQDVPAGWYLRSIQRASEEHGIPVIARPLSEGWDLPDVQLGGMIVLSKTQLPVTIPEELDVDGRDPNSHHTLYSGGLKDFPRNTPCTAEGCQPSTSVIASSAYTPTSSRPPPARTGSSSLCVGGRPTER